MKVIILTEGGKKIGFGRLTRVYDNAFRNNSYFDIPAGEKDTQPIKVTHCKENLIYDR